MAARALAINDWTDTMAAADLTKVLTAIEGLKVEVGYMVTGLKDLTRKVETMDDQKAGRVEVQAVELRLKEVIAEGKAGTVVSVAQVKAEVTYMVSQNNVALASKLDGMSSQMETLQGAVADLERIRWKVTGIAAAVGAIAATVLPWVGKLLFH